MEKAEIKASLQQDLDEAIYYLPQNFDLSILCKALKAVYSDTGKQKAEKWLIDTKNGIPTKFDEFWDGLKLTPYQRNNVLNFLKKQIFDIAKQTGWVPKAIRKGKQAKKPPNKKAKKQLAEEIEATKDHKNRLSLIKQRGLSKERQDHLPSQVLNIYGGCYIQKAIKKKDIPENKRDHKAILQKIADCEVEVLEAIEMVKPSQQREAEDKEVRYLLKLDDKNGKHVISTVTFEELTTRTRFSNFLVKKGFIKFMGGNKEFDRFHEFLINKQKYPTVRDAYSWGEWRDGVFLFKNGIYDVTKNQFFEADQEQRIQYGENYVLCPSGQEQIRPPQLSVNQNDSDAFLAEKFSLWTSFNGEINVKTTIGYALACVFSAEIIDRNNGFPLLFKYGERGTGKSSSMDWFMALFGYPQGNRQSISKQNTLVALKRMMTLPRSFPYFLDDYRSHQNNSQAPDLTSSILNWYHRIGTSMGEYSNDRRTVETPMKACVVMTGNDKPVDEAALSRMIVLNYNKFLKREQLNRIPEIANHTARFSEFLYLILENYDEVREQFFKSLLHNKQFLSAQDFEGRTVDNWGIVLAGIDCVPVIIPSLNKWKHEFEPLRNKICDYIRKQEQLQSQQNPIHEFFQVIEHFATQKTDPESRYDKSYNLIDNRHFKIREYETINNESGTVIYKGSTLALHIRGIWNVLEDKKAKITWNTSLAEMEGKLQNSSYFLDKSVQVLLTKSIEEGRKTSNRRCYLLNVDELRNKGMLEELIQKACDYEKPNVSYSNY